MWTVFTRLRRWLWRREGASQTPKALPSADDRPKPEPRPRPTVEEIRKAIESNHLTHPYDPRPSSSKMDRWFEKRSRQRGDEYHRKKIEEMLAEAGIDPADRQEEPPSGEIKDER